MNWNNEGYWIDELFIAHSSGIAIEQRNYAAMAGAKLIMLYTLFKGDEDLLSPLFTVAIWRKKETKYTGKVDINGDKINEGDVLTGETIDGNTGHFKVKWSDYRGVFIGEGEGEIYDISESIFHKYEIV